jgi:flagellar biosynthesis protein FliR
MRELIEIVVTALLCGSRISGLMLCSPLLSHNALAAPVKALLMVGIVALVFPLAATYGVTINSPSQAAAVVGSEALIGAVMGLSVSFVFEMFQVAGQAIGLQMGLSLATVFDPQSNADSPVIAMLAQMLVLLIFVALDVHLVVLRAVANSYSYLPPGVAIRTGALTEALWRLAGTVWTGAVQIAAPILLVTMSLDLVLGIMGKASPQLPVLFMGMSLKNIASLMLLLVGIRLWPAWCARQFEVAVTTGERLLHGLH